MTLTKKQVAVYKEILVGKNQFTENESKELKALNKKGLISLNPYTYKVELIASYSSLDKLNKLVIKNPELNDLIQPVLEKAEKRYNIDSPMITALLYASEIKSCERLVKSGLMSKIRVGFGYGYYFNKEIKRS